MAAACGVFPESGSSNLTVAVGNCLHSFKCFCPYCLQTKPYFILPWRFNVLPGCQRIGANFLGSDVRLSRRREKGSRGVGWKYEHKPTYQTATSTGNFSMCE